jgi:thymidine phosphorylase
VCDDPAGTLPSAPVRQEVAAAASGVVTALPARAVGEMAAALGAGRSRPGDRVDPAVGVELDVEIGSKVAAGDRIGVIFARQPDAAAAAAARLADLVDIGDDVVEPPPVILDRIG